MKRDRRYRAINIRLQPINAKCINAGAVEKGDGMPLATAHV